MKMWVIADRDTALAFNLAGISGFTARNAAEVADILQGIEAREVGLVLITEKLADTSRRLLDTLRLLPQAPLILEIPDLSGPAADRKGAAEQMIDWLRS